MFILLFGILITTCSRNFKVFCKAVEFWGVSKKKKKKKKKNDNFVLRNCKLKKDGINMLEGFRKGLIAIL